MEENKNALDEINKGCTMGIESINNLIDRVESKDLKEILEKLSKTYYKFEDKIQKKYNEYTDKDPHEIGLMEKIMSSYMVNMKMMKDHSDSKIAELLLEGLNMGIIEGRKILNNKKLEEDVEKLLGEFISEQEEVVEELKKFL